MSTNDSEREAETYAKRSITLEIPAAHNHPIARSFRHERRMGSGPSSDIASCIWEY
jgi:hypothetical protein